MRKIPTIFERDWDGDRSRVLNLPAAGCGWVFAGEGVATRKYDGTCCLLRAGRLYKRHEVKIDKRTGQLREIPDMFEEVERDAETGAIVGWIPVGDGPEDRWHREALAVIGENGFTPRDGTYELVGPKIQRNPEQLDQHLLVPHASAEQFVVPRDFDGIRDALGQLDVEGFVFHHPDGRMAKIKARDFGLTRVSGRVA